MKLGESAPELKQLANVALASVESESASIASSPLSLRWGLMGRRAQGVSLRTPKDQMLQILLKISQTLEITLRREEVPFWWNTVQVLWGPGWLWRGQQHRPGRTAILSVGPHGRLKGSSPTASLRLPDGSRFQDCLWVLDAAACEVEVPEGGLQFTVVAYQDCARDVVNKGSS